MNRTEPNRFYWTEPNRTFLLGPMQQKNYFGPVKMDRTGRVEDRTGTVGDRTGTLRDRTGSVKTGSVHWDRTEHTFRDQLFYFDKCDFLSKVFFKNMQKSTNSDRTENFVSVRSKFDHFWLFVKNTFERKSFFCEIKKLGKQRKVSLYFQSLRYVTAQYIESIWQDENRLHY